MAGESATSEHLRTAEPRAAIIEAVKTPLGLAALAVLVIDGLLTVLALRANGADFSRLVIGILALAFVLAAIILFFIIQYSREKQREYDSSRLTMSRSTSSTDNTATTPAVLHHEVKAELTRLQQELEAYTSLRGPLLAVLSTKKSVQLDTILSQLGSAHDGDARMHILSVLGTMINEGIVRHSTTPGWYYLEERR